MENSTEAPDSGLQPITLGIPDIVVVVVYFGFVLVVGIWSSVRASRGTVGGYFLAGRTMKWWPIGASLMSSNVGSGLFVGMAGSGAAGGLAVGGFEWNASWVLVALGWIFVPVYIASGVVTMPEYLKKRFGGERIRIYMSLLSLLLYIFTKISTDIYSGALFIQVSLGWNIYLSTVLLLVVTAIYTVAGGLTAVIYTDTLQTVIMVVGAFVLMFISFQKVGWYEGLEQKYMVAIPKVIVPNTTCHLPRSDAFHMLRDPITGDLPWPGLIFGLTVLATWVWCTDQCNEECPDLYIRETKPQLHQRMAQHRRTTSSGQESAVYLHLKEKGHSFEDSHVHILDRDEDWFTRGVIEVIVQRSLAAKNLSHAKGGSIVGGYLKILPTFFVVLPGMISRALFPDEIGCVHPEECWKYCKVNVSCSNIAYPKLVITLMPVGIKGLMIAVIIAALMSSLTSIFNSASTIFTLDIWSRIRRNAREQELMIVGRIFIVALVVISILWIPIIQAANSGLLFDYMQSVTSYLAPPVTAIFILAIFVKRVNEPGAFWGLLIGLVVGLIRMVMDFVYQAPNCGEEDKRPSVLKNVHYLYFAILLFGLTVIFCIVISLFTPAMSDEEIGRFTWWTRKRKEININLDEQMETSNNTTESSRNLPIEKEPGGTIVQEDEVLKDSSSITEQKSINHAASSPWWKKVYFWFCGLSMQPEVKLSKEEEEKLQRKLTSIDEEPLWRSVCNVNAIILLTINVFLWGYFA